MSSNNVSSPPPSPGSSSVVRSSSTRDSSVEPPRKRSRTDLSPDQRKEARAHRNRIAAQNSRDKRKAHFSYLEKRVSELEDENHRLRAGMGLSQLAQREQQKIVESERELAKERENQELKERIKSLESGWTAVVQALQASGLPLNVPALPTPANTESEQPSQDPPTKPSTTAFPVFVPQRSVLPISPTLSHASLSSSGLLDEFESTRHLARVATIDAGGLATNQEYDELTPVSDPSSFNDIIDEMAMDHFLREIIDPASPSSPVATLSDETQSPNGQITAESTAASPPASSMTSDDMDVQKLLETLTSFQPEVEDLDLSSILELELGEWGQPSSEVAVF